MKEQNTQEVKKEIDKIMTKQDTNVMDMSSNIQTSKEIDLQTATQKTKKINFNDMNPNTDDEQIVLKSPTEKKPLLRGRIHQMAFYKTLVLFLVLITTNLLYQTFSLALVIYFASQLTLYGTSFIYHTTKFTKESTRRLVQRLDHTSIFILISGTQSSVFLCYVTDKRVVAALLITTWTISILGVFKIIVMQNIVEMLDVLFYIGHGICVVPFFGKLKHVVMIWEFVLFILGGVLYIMGGLAFGFEWPNPWPNVLGFHEIFHVLTVLANTCFLVPVLVKYISELVVMVGQK